MMDTIDPPMNVIFQGMEFGSELMGASQANYFVPSHDREVAVMVNEPAIEYALNELGLEDTKENRDLVVSHLGQLVLLRKLERGILELVDFLGMGVFEDEPGILDDLRERLKPA